MTGLAWFTLFHVLLSIIGIGFGLVVVYGLILGQRMDRPTAAFLGFTVATVLTGFLFPFNGFTPALAVGILSSVLLALALAARYRYAMVGGWRTVYVTAAVASLYPNCFVFVVQAFQKVPVLHVLAPQGTEPPFAAVQALVLLSFVLAGYLAVKRFRFDLAAA